MADWPLWAGGGGYDSLGVSAAGSNPTLLPTPSVANTKTAWQELVASTTARYSGFFLHVIREGNYGQGLIDIAIGAAGSELLIAENLVYEWYYKYTQSAIFLPIEIPSGQRVAARWQSNQTTGDLYLSMTAARSSPRAPVAFHRATVLGADTTDSGGTNVDAGATTNTKGAYSELSASAPHPIKLLYLMATNAGVGARGTGRFLVDVSVGAAAAEQPVLGDIALNGNTAEEVLPSIIGPIPVDIPAGARISVRAQCHNNAVAARQFDAAVIGIG